jgi:DNA-binding NarL/FixJ family response regulator
VGAPEKGLLSKENRQVSSEKKITVLAVDDHPLFRSGIAAVLQPEPDIVLVGEASDGKEAIERFRDHLPDVTLMDLQMPVMNGIDAMTAIRVDFPSARFVALTTYRGDIQVLRALRAGATGYLLKSTLREELADTIRTVHAGRRWVPSEIANEISEHVTDDSLSGREIEVLRRVARGASNKIIGEQLSISEATVKSHVQNILSKLGANDRTHAVTIATKRGYLE